jgi:hypothetical protein
MRHCRRQPSGFLDLPAQSLPKLDLSSRREPFNSSSRWARPASRDELVACRRLASAVLCALRGGGASGALLLATCRARALAANTPLAESKRGRGSVPRRPVARTRGRGKAGTSDRSATATDADDTARPAAGDEQVGRRAAFGALHSSRRGRRVSLFPSDCAASRRLAESAAGAAVPAFSA